MSETEKAFIQKADGMASDLEAIARIIRRTARRKSGTCVDRALEVFSVVSSGTANLPHEAMIRRAVVADRERDNDPQP